MKYKPKPTEARVHKSQYGHEIKEIHWDVQFEEDGGYIFNDQDDAMIFCLLLEIRDLLGSQISEMKEGKKL